MCLNIRAEKNDTSFLVSKTGFEPARIDYKSIALPLSYFEEVTHIFTSAIFQSTPETLSATII